MEKIKFEYKITLGYLIIGFLWIIFSDEILLYFVPRSELLTKIQIFKGWFYVLNTGLLLYSLLKQHLIKIRNAELKARESDRLKSKFIQNISHEIRTPMNGILGFASLLSDEDLTDNQKKYLDKIKSSSDRLLIVLNEILDISMIESGSINTSDSDIYLNELIEDIYNSFKPLITNEIEFSFSNGLDNKLGFIRTDEAKIRQVLIHLLENAIKFTNKGKIEFGYSLGNKKLEFFVKDTGIGIPSTMHTLIFEAFHKYENESQQKQLFKGIGLGLSICKGYVELLKGEIWVKSEENRGSEFYFTIPYKTANSEGIFKEFK